MYKVGDKIKIICMDGEPQYAGKQGEITFIGRDCDNELCYRGTWEVVLFIHLKIKLKK